MSEYLPPYGTDTTRAPRRWVGFLRRLADALEHAEHRQFHEILPRLQALAEDAGRLFPGLAEVTADGPSQGC